MPPVFVIAGKDLRLRFRDRSAIVLGFVAPLVISGLMSLAFGGSTNFHVTVAVANRDNGPVASAFVHLLRSRDLHDLITVRTTASAADARATVKDRHAEAGIAIPAGFSAAALRPAGAASIAVFTSVDNRLSGQVVRSIVDSFAAQVDANRLSVATALAAGAPAATLSAQASKLQIPEQAVLRPIGARPLKPISYFAPGMALFFLFFAVSFGSRSFFVERREGTLDRMVAAPITPTSVLVGKALSVFVYGSLSLATVAVVTTLVFGADWGSPPAAALLCLAMVIAVVSLTAFVTVIARNERQVDGLSSIVVFGLALLGGNFIFVSAAPSYMRKLALITPNGWALRGFTDLATGLGPSAAVEPVLAILAFSALVGGAAAVFARKAIVV